MANIRVDKNTGIWYSHTNIPLGRGTGKSGAIVSIQKNGKYYKIMSLNAQHPDDSWYGDTFIGDMYAVFEWVNTSTTSGFYQQITKWYNRYGWAKRRLLELAKEG